MDSDGWKNLIECQDAVRGSESRARPSARPKKNKTRKKDELTRRVTHKVVAPQKTIAPASLKRPAMKGITSGGSEVSRLFAGGLGSITLHE